MSTQIQVQRSTHETNTPSLVFGEFGYSTRGSGENDRKGYLYIGDHNNTNRLVGGDHFIQMLDHTVGCLVANSALITDADSKLEEIKNLTI